MEAATCRGSPSSLGKIKYLENERGGKERKGFSLFLAAPRLQQRAWGSQPASEATLQPAMNAYTFIYLFELA